MLTIKLRLAILRVNSMALLLPIALTESLRKGQLSLSKACSPWVRAALAGTFAPGPIPPIFQAFKHSALVKVGAVDKHFWEAL